MRLYLQRHKQLLTRMQTTLNESNTQNQLKLKLMSVIKGQKLEILMEEKKYATAYHRERPPKPTPTRSSRMIKKEINGRNVWVREEYDVPEEEYEDEEWAEFETSWK